MTVTADRSRLEDARVTWATASRDEEKAAWDRLYDALCPPPQSTAAGQRVTAMARCGSTAGSAS